MSRMRIDEIEIRDADIFEILLDNFPDMIHSIDDEGNIIYTNKTAETLLGYTRDELLTMHIKQIYADRVLREMEKGFSALKQEGDKNIPESWLKTKNGDEVPVEIRSFSIYDDEGNFLRTFSILRDLRTVKDLQRSLAHAGRLAAIGELSSGVAHDINNPLTVIMLSNEVMMRQINAADTTGNPLITSIVSQSESIKKASHSIQKLANHLRNFSRGVAEKREIVDIATSIEDSLFMINSKAMKANVRVENNLEKEKYFVYASPNQLEQVFVNLMSNACDAMEKSADKCLSLSVETSDIDGVACWKCNVSDTGSGIDQAIIDEIFQSFFTTKAKGSGTGLGLSISRGIIDEHKGRIDVASEVGKGTTFSVLLPQQLDGSLES